MAIRTSHWDSESEANRLRVARSCGTVGHAPCVFVRARASKPRADKLGRISEVASYGKSLIDNRPQLPAQHCRHHGVADGFACTTLLHPQTVAQHAACSCRSQGAGFTPLD